MTPAEIITDEEIIRVHANAKFGSMTPRQVVADGVRKYSMGYSGGSTMVAILREHGLITNPGVMGYNADLTKKGKAYLRSISSYDAPIPAEAARLDRIEKDPAEGSMLPFGQYDTHKMGK